MQARTFSVGRFASWPDFLDRTAGEDREFLPEEAVDRFPAVCCGMANGIGGWIVLGAFLEEESPVPQGLSDPSALERRLRAALAGDRTLSTDTVSSFQVLDVEGLPLLAARVDPADWYRRPVCAGGDYRRGVYRRVEGIDLVSGRQARFQLALDALERLRGDAPLPGLTAAELHEESVASFREAVTARRPEWGHLSQDAFLARTLVLADGALTRAGHLLLGKRATRVRAEFLGASGEEEIFEVRCLWKAYADLLPRFCEGLSPACMTALRECFLNALIHADHDQGIVRVTGRSDTVRIESPGLPRTSRRRESLCRNVRLMRMFQLAGAADGEGRGLEAIRAYHPDFVLSQNLLELATVAELDLERAAMRPEVIGISPEALFLPIAPLDPPKPKTEAGEGSETAAAAPLSKFLVVPSSEEREPSAEILQTGMEGGDGELFFGPDMAPTPEERDKAIPPADEAKNTLGHSKAEESETVDPEPSASVPPSPPQEGAEGVRGGRKFAFGSAAEELELAVAQMRRGESALNAPEAVLSREGGS